ncbi:MAG: hypothetical protein JNM84_18335 [Planctomycetes bacterium]|nr:hypothetical protein [Planctomycetota bacterium]
MNKTNLLLLLVAAALGAAAWATREVTNDAARPSAEEERSSYRRYVVDLPRLGAMPDLEAVRGLRIVPPRVEKKDELDGPSNLEREELEGELVRVLWDLLPPARRAALHEGGGDPDWNALKAAPALRALLERCAGLVADTQARLKPANAVSWGEVEAFAADATLRESFLQQMGNQLVPSSLPRLYVVGVQQLNQIEGAVANLQRGRPGGASAALSFGELQTPTSQNVRDALVQVLAKAEGIVAPWRRPLRHLERLLGGKPRHGFAGFDEEAWISELEERAQAVLELARAEALDHPNPEEFERRRRGVVDALQALLGKIPAWRDRARSLTAERAALREACEAMPEASRTIALESWPPQQPQRLGYTLALVRAIQGGLPPDAQAFLQRAKRFAEEELKSFYIDLRAGVAPLAGLPTEVEAMLRTAPRDVVLARGADGAWRVSSEGGFPASGERLDGVEIPPTSARSLSPLGGLRTLIELGRAAIARRLLKEGGQRAETGPPALLVALADLLANDPRGAWLPRERDYGFDERAVEIVLEGANGAVLDRVRFGAPDAEAANPPPWIEGQRKADLVSRNMAYAHSFNTGRRLAYRVEWLPRVATVRPHQELRRQDFLYGDRRLVPAATPEAFRRVSITRDGASWIVERNAAEEGAAPSWSLQSGALAGAAMDEGLARRFLSQLSALYLEGVAAEVQPGSETWKRFGFDAPQLRFDLRADAFREELLFGVRVRRDGKLYVACTASGAALGSLTAGGHYAFLVEAAVFQTLREAVDQVAEEARLLSAGPLCSAETLAAVERVVLSEGAAEGGPAPSLELVKRAGLWLAPAAADHPVDPRLVEGAPQALLDKLRVLQRAYPFAGLGEAQRADLARRLESGTRIALYGSGAEPLVLELASDADPTLGGERLAARRRSGATLQIARLVGSDELFLVPALELPELSLGAWLDLQWQRPLEPVKQATALGASGEALAGAELALAKDASGWKRGETAIDAALVEEALNWLENLGATDVAAVSEGAAPWLVLRWSAGGPERTLELYRSAEGESALYVARVPERAATYRVSPIVVDPLIAALKRLAAL